jgi:hypothetical protein
VAGIEVAVPVWEDWPIRASMFGDAVEPPGPADTGGVMGRTEYAEPPKGMWICWSIDVDRWRLPWGGCDGGRKAEALSDGLTESRDGRGLLYGSVVLSAKG